MLCRPKMVHPKPWREVAIFSRYLFRATSGMPCQKKHCTKFSYSRRHEALNPPSPYLFPDSASCGSKTFDFSRTLNPSAWYTFPARKTAGLLASARQKLRSRIWNPKADKYSRVSTQQIWKYHSLSFPSPPGSSLDYYMNRYADCLMIRPPTAIPLTFPFSAILAPCARVPGSLTLHMWSLSPKSLHKSTR